MKIVPAFSETDNESYKLSFKERLKRFMDSDFVFYTTIILLRSLEIALFAGAFYFAMGGRL